MTMMMIVVVVVVLCTIFQGYFSEASSIVFGLRGNIDSRWAYSTTINIGRKPKPFNIGRKPKPFNLQVDTASDLTWVRCDGPCENCDSKSRKYLYKPPEGSIVQCQDPLCVVVQGKQRKCENPTDRCDYTIRFADQSITHGYLVRDKFSMHLTTGKVIDPTLVFGCGYKQIGEFDESGILGLSRGSLGFLSQMNSQGLIQNVIGHCLRSGEGGGFVFLGDDLVPPSGISWTPITNNYHEDRDYLSGPADLLFDGIPTKVKGLTFDFDSGCALSFLNQPAYQHALDMVNQALVNKPLIPAEPESDELSVCWRQQKPIRSLNEVQKYFKNLTFSFTNQQNVNMVLPPRAYLIVIDGKVCLGISDGDKHGLENANLIGAVLMQDKLVIYDNVKHRIGWASNDCNMYS